jgi:hypothetical protein
VRFRSQALARFWECYDRLPEDIQARADKQFTLFTHDPFHASLRLKPVGPFWSVRITRAYRALALRREDEFIWFWIGAHEEYERLLMG